MAHAAQAATSLQIAAGNTASPARERRWRVVDKLGKQIIRDLLRDSRTGTPQRELAERYGISVSSVKRTMRKRAP